MSTGGGACGVIQCSDINGRTTAMMPRRRHRDGCGRSRGSRYCPRCVDFVGRGLQLRRLLIGLLLQTLLRAMPPRSRNPGRLVTEQSGRRRRQRNRPVLGRQRQCGNRRDGGGRRIRRARCRQQLIGGGCARSKGATGVEQQRCVRIKFVQPCRRRRISTQRSQSRRCRRSQLLASRR